MSRLSMGAGLLALALAEPASGQAIRCLVPFEASPTSADCVVHQVAGSSSVDIVLEVRNAAGQPATARRRVWADWSAGSLDYTRRTGPGGVVRATLSGSIKSDVEVVFHAGSAVRKIIVKPAQPAATPLEIVSGDKQYWFQGFELHDPLVVRLTGLSDESQCKKTPVAFRTVAGGKIMADTVFGDLINKECRAATRWTLDNRVGYQGLRAATPGDKSGVLFEARSRRLPRVFLGAFTGWRPGYDKRTSKPDTVLVTTDADGTKEVTKRIDKHYDATDQEAGLTIDPVVGFDFPLWYKLEAWRVSVGAAVDDFDHEWFVGLSILQPTQGFLQEAMGMDLHFALKILKRDEVVDPDSCADNTCVTRTRTQLGFGVMVVTDGLGVVTNLIKALGGG